MNSLFRDICDEKPSNILREGTKWPIVGLCMFMISRRHQGAISLKNIMTCIDVSGCKISAVNGFYKYCIGSNNGKVLVLWLHLFMQRNTSSYGS